MKKIKTGADKLVEIIQESKKISLDDSAKALGVSKDLVLEWAEFLEKERLISIDYSFSKVFFTERTMTSKEIKESAKEVVFEKDAFVNKIEYALASLEKESVNFKEIKKKFGEVQAGVKKELKIVETELAELEKYNELKSNIDKDIAAQKEKYVAEIESLNLGIKAKEDEFVKLYSKIVKEKEEIDSHKEKILSIKKAQGEISDSIENAKNVLSKLKQDTYNEERSLADKQKSFESLRKDFEKLSDNVIREKKKKIDSLSSSLSKESKEVLGLQDKLFKEASAKISKLQNYEDVGKKLKSGFEGFFDRIIKISKRLDEIELDKEELTKSLVALRDKAKALKVMDGNASFSKQARALEEEIKKQEQKKKNLLGKIHSLLNDLKV